MKKKFRILSLLDNDGAVRILSVVAAVIVWLIVTITAYPNTIAIIEDIPVKIDLANTTPEAYNLSVIEGENQTVDIQVEGIREKILMLTAEDFVAVPTLTPVNKAGEYQIAIEVKKANERDEDYSITQQPAPIKVKFDQLINKEFTLQVNAENVVPADGYIREEAFVNPEKVVLHGPESEISKIVKAVVKTEASSTASETLVVDGELAFYDGLGNIISFKHTTHDTADYEITIPINKLRTVPITFNFVNIPQGIDTTKLKYTMSETSIKLAGPSKVVDAINELSLGEIDFRMIDIGYTTEFDVSVPPGVMNVDNLSNVTIDFTDSNLESNTFTIPEKNILLRNVPSNYTIKLDTKSINNVKMVGLPDDVDKLAANDLVAYIDFSGKEITEGSSRQNVQIYVTGNKTAWAVGEYRAVVSITKKS